MNVVALLRFLRFVDLRRILAKTGVVRERGAYDENLARSALAQIGRGLGDIAAARRGRLHEQEQIGAGGERTRDVAGV